MDSSPRTFVALKLQQQWRGAIERKRNARTLRRLARALRIRMQTRKSLSECAQSILKCIDDFEALGNPKEIVNEAWMQWNEIWDMLPATEDTLLEHREEMDIIGK